jgi:hypothetical protein
MRYVTAMLALRFALIATAATGTRARFAALTVEHSCYAH